jgi:2-polyprenyl-3-methyl-5-hydroxy-6-metoxy-1,4-benzoquinol methylase
MKQKRCYLCSSDDFERVEGKVRNMPDMHILRCLKCGLVFLESFDHVTDAFYEDSGMRGSNDIAAVEGYMKERLRDDLHRVELLKLEVTGKSLLDFGCGSGGFLAIIKDYTKKCAGVEKDKHLIKIAKEKFDIVVYSDISEIKGSFDIITLFHVLEHIKDPKYILSKLSSLLNKDGRIIIEVPNANDALLSLYKCKAFSEFTYWGCHLYLFNNFCLKKITRDSGLVLDYIKQIQRYPLSNHLYWLAEGKPGGHKIWNFMDTDELNNAYRDKLSEFLACDTIIASARRAE